VSPNIGENREIISNLFPKMKMPFLVGLSLSPEKNVMIMLNHQNPIQRDPLVRKNIPVVDY
jgi:hypothetical protein